MRIRVLFSALLLAGGLVTLSLTYGQSGPPGPPAAAPPAPPASPPAPVPAPTVVVPPAPAKALAPARDLSRLSPLQKQMLLSAQRGADWLFRNNNEKGRFRHGFLPAVNKEMTGDNYLRQAGAAFALARAARFTGEERYAARAAQAVLALLDDTQVSSTDARARHTSLPSTTINRVGAAALLIMAINELPSPQSDLLEKSEQLCHYIRSQARPDGSLALHEAADPTTDEEISEFPGLALYALMLSQKHRPAEWKIDLVRKALPFYRAWWATHRNMLFVPWQTAAYAEAYVATHEPAFAAAVYEMNDWICGLQYTDMGGFRPMLMCGGFKSFADGRPIETEPKIDSALYAAGLGQASRVACNAGDVARHERYTQALERSLQFLSALQYTNSNTQHFAGWYQKHLLGAFYVSHVDGNLRIDNTQHAVAALVFYLEHVTR